jgi:hypothetical protein
MIQKKGFLKNEDAVVGLITAILIVGLIVTVFASVQTIFVPQWMEENEAAHLREVKNQFMQLKFALDVQVYNPASSEMKLTTPLTLGSEKIPYFLSEKSSGELGINDDGFHALITGNDSSFDRSLNTFYYQSQNSYYPDQRFTYEAGAIVLSQSEGYILASSPFFSLSQTDENLTVSWTMIDVLCNTGKTSAHGSSTCSILTQYVNNSETTIHNVSSIQITTKYPLVWSRYLNNTLTSEELQYGEEYLIDIDNLQNDEIILEFNTEKQVNFVINKVNVSIQINPGLIN